MEQEKKITPYEGTFISYDPVILVLDAVKKWLLVVVVAAICGMAAYIYTDVGFTPYYKTETTMVLSTRDSASSVYDNLDSTTRLAGVFTEILNSSVMRNKVLDALEMDSFNGTIKATAIDETNLLTLQVTASDPRTAFLVTQALLQHHESVTYVVMGDIVLEVLEPPVVPSRPANAVDSFSTMRKVMLIAAVATFFILIMLAYFNDVVRSKQEAEVKLDCWCLGEIAHERKRRRIKDILTRKKKALLITNPGTSFRYLTTINKLRRRVEQSLGRGKVVMVTSVMENEGKSTVAANLALAMARKHKRVLLIDGDLYKPACRKIMEHPTPEYVVQDLIRGTAKLEQAVQIDKLSRLELVFAKRSLAREASELIGSAAFGELLNDAREKYDYIVVDLPPMSVATATEVVMEHADGSLLVVRQNWVRTPDLNRAIADLQRGSAKMMGCVLNNVYSTQVFSGEGYAAGYGRYGSYGSYGRYGKYGRYGAYASQNAEE